MLEKTTMLSESISIPFSISEAFGGFGTAEGILHYETNRLKIELEPKLLGFIVSGIQEKTIPLSEILHVEFKTGWTHRTLTLQAKSLKTFDGITGTKQGKLELSIGKSDVSLAEHLATMVSAHLTTQQLNRIQNDLNSI